MKKITEQQLIHSADLLNKKLAMMEAAAAAQAQPAQNRDWSWQNVGKAAGNLWNGAAGAVMHPADTFNKIVSDVGKGFNSAQTPTTGTAAQPAATNKWPTTPQEITAFQKANGLTADGLIGPKTMQALAKQGIQPPAGFQMAGAKKPAAPAKPADPMAQSPEEAEDERIAQNQAFYNMSPEQQAMYNKGVAQQGQKPAAAPANAQTPATAPNAAAAAITPNFASQQGAQPAAQPAAETGGPIQSTGDAAKDRELAKQNPGSAIVYNESSDQEMTRFKNLFPVEDIFESIKEPQQHVTFQQEDTLARIIQLSKKEIK